jgi:protein ImuB
MDGRAMSSELYLCVYVREFPAQALLRMRPELHSRAIAVMDGEPPFQQVCSLNKFARKLGVERGMSRAEMDSFPSVVLLARSQPEELAARHALLESAGSFSPRVEVLDNEFDFSCVFDIAGTEKLFGSPQTLAIRVQNAFATVGVTSSLAVSANFHTAVCQARGLVTGRDTVVISLGDERRALAHLPLSVLDLSPEYAERFSQWGVATLGELAMLPEKDLIARLGQEGKRLRLLARGESEHLFLPIEPVLALEECIELDLPVDILDSLLFGVSLMLEQLISRAKARILSLAVVTAELCLEGGGLHTRVVRPALPTNEKQLWLKLLHLDWIAHPPHAAVVSLRLKAETGKTGKVQLGLFSPQLPEPGRLDVTLARIRALVGEDRVGSVEIKDTHHPDAFRLKPFSLAASSIETTTLLEPRFPAAALRCLRPAEHVTMTIRNNRPHSFYFRGLGYEAERCYGPWRAAGDWWSENLWSIEEWDIIARVRENTFSDKTSSLLCCCMTRDRRSGRWHIEALYD